jgi:Tol biopolymer transport system component
VPVKDNEEASGPHMLPGGRSVLYTLINSNGAILNWEAAQIVVQTVGSPERRTFRMSGADARYVPSGHIVYALGGVLFAVPFDVRRLEVTGGPVSVVEGVASGNFGAANPGTGAAQFDFSRTGSLTYVAGPASTTSSLSQLDVALFDRSGNIQRLKLPPRPYYAPRVSLDGRWLAVGIDDGKEADIWVYDMSGTSAIRRLSFGGKNRFPIWTPDSQRVAFQSDREGDGGIFWQRADGTGAAERLTKAEPGKMHVPDSWSSKGDTFLFTVKDADGFSLWTFSVRENKAVPFDAVRTQGIQPNAAFSPDGRWVTYASANLSDRTSGIYVQPFPPTGAKFLIGAGTPATNPFWSPDGKELYYSEGARAMFSVVGVRTEPTFSFGNATDLPRPGVVGTTPGLPRNYDIAPDGKHFVVVVDSKAASPGTQTAQIEVVLNWLEELRRLVPTK